MVIRTGLVSLSLLFAASTALADETNYAARDTNVTKIDAPRDRVEVYGGLAMGTFTREAGSQGGFALGGEAAYVFNGIHGIRVGYGYGGGIFGPTVHLFDLDYSAQWNTSNRLDKVSASFGVLFGPSVGIVSYDGNDPQQHATFGGRAGAFADLHLWWATIGLDGSFRFGMSSGYGAESWGCVGLHAGITFDIARR